jgi:Cu-processing system ATP-binding protein
MMVILYEGFTKSFGSVQAVHNLNLEVVKGETLALVGPNGSGKTTTLKAALGLVLPTSGSVSVCGARVDPRVSRTRGRVGYLPQRLSFPEGCTATEVLRLYARLRDVASDTIPELLDRVGLASDASRFTDCYSGGMRQRLGIAVALLGSPDILILDEPTSALDPSGAIVVRDIIRGIAAGGTTVVLSSHDLAEVEALADRVAIFVDARLRAIGTLRELSVSESAVSLEAVYRSVTDSRRAA